MKTYKEVDELIGLALTSGGSKPEVAWNAALACVGWPYVFGARGELCTPSNRRARYSSAHPTIKTACKNFDGTKACDGCKWFPSCTRVRCFDCRGFTYWILKQVGIKLNGAGATSQWNDASNWEAKGTIDTCPSNQLVCLFVNKGEKMEHTGLGYGNETCECSSGVQHFTKRNKKWTHWALPKGLYTVIDGNSSTDISVPTTSVDLPTLRRGSKGEYVTTLQTMLVNKGYDVGSYGVDGDFGSGTLAAVKKFQTDAGLTVDGVVGPKTWKALETAPISPDTYKVVITGLSKSQAEDMAAACINYNVSITKE